jgi:hypothetical protein
MLEYRHWFQTIMLIYCPSVFNYAVFCSYDDSAVAILYRLCA